MYFNEKSVKYFIKLHIRSIFAAKKLKTNEKQYYHGCGISAVHFCLTGYLIHGGQDDSRAAAQVHVAYQEQGHRTGGPCPEGSFRLRVQVQGECDFSSRYT